jgi:hypothetical protein
MIVRESVSGGPSILRTVASLVEWVSAALRRAALLAGLVSGEGTRENTDPPGSQTIWIAPSSWV